ALHELLLELRVAELARHDFAMRDAAVGRNRQRQDELALQARILPQRAVVQRVDRALVAVEHALDLFTAARRFAARAAARAAVGASAGLRRGEGALDLRRRARGESAAARVAAQRGGIDAAAAATDAGCDEAAL